MDVLQYMPVSTNLTILLTTLKTFLMIWSFESTAEGMVLVIFDWSVWISNGGHGLLNFDWSDWITIFCTNNQPGYTRWKVGGVVRLWSHILLAWHRVIVKSCMSEQQFSQLVTTFSPTCCVFSAICNLGVWYLYKNLITHTNPISCAYTQTLHL